MIMEFHAVTVSESHYEVKGVGKDGYPSVKKISLRGDRSGANVGTELLSVPDAKIGIGYFICTYKLSDLERSALIAEASNWWMGNTSDIVALFKTSEEAEKCLTFESLVPADERWEKETRKVLTEIGDYHPVFTIFPDSKSPLLFEVRI